MIYQRFCKFEAEVFLDHLNFFFLIHSTGKSLSEALIFASTNPQYDDKLYIVHENCKLRIPAEHAVSILKLLFLFCFDIQNNFGTQNVLQMLRASEKDLPVGLLLVIFAFVLLHFLD